MDETYRPHDLTYMSMGRRIKKRRQRCIIASRHRKEKMLEHVSLSLLKNRKLETWIVSTLGAMVQDHCDTSKFPHVRQGPVVPANVSFSTLRCLPAPHDQR